MKHSVFQLIAFFLIITHIEVFAQSAPWVSYPSANQTAYGVYHFRKSFNLDQMPEKLVIHVSADNRYNLFVNGQRVCYGPAKGDLETYKYDVIDIARYLKPGKNVLAALVYNGGNDKPLAFFSVQTAFMLRTESPDLSSLNTGSGWKVFKNPAYTVISYNEMLFRERWFYGFYACGGGDEVDGKLFPWGWELSDFDDTKWLVAELLKFDGKASWNLVPRNIAFMDNHSVQPVRIRKTSGANISTGLWDGKTRLTIPSNTKASILVDFEIFTMGYPELTIDRGVNSSVKIKYAEALYEQVNLKAHRDSVNGKTMNGVWDIFHPDGKQRTFRPLWKRTFRYVQFNVETKAEPLDILSYQLEYSGYPYPEMATFESDNPRLNDIFEISKRTLRMCSGETYYDTPFYEQLSYGGDNRPIAAISTYNSTDDQLLREVLRLYPQSENKETGLFKSAYPSRFDFDMGSWSMGWIQTLHDYYFMRGDSGFVKQFSGKIDGVLRFYERHLDERTGMIGTVKNQNFIDWSITKGSLPRANEWNGFEEMASSYFSFFMFKAMEKTGQEDLFIDNLDFWYTFIDRGHTTCGETGFDSHDRSDCHAWSAHPAYFMLSSVCGIKPADVGFNSVKITPHPGNLNYLQADMPHPKGRISVEYKKEKGKWKTVIVLPVGMKGRFNSGQFNYNLVEGKNVFDYKVVL